MKSAKTTVSLDSLELDFQHYWLILKRRWRPAAMVFGATLLLTLLAAYLQKPTYKAQGKLLFKVDRTSALTGLGAETEKANPLYIESNPTKTQAEVVLSIPIMQKTIEALNLREKQGNPVKPEKLIEQLKAKNIAGTDVLQLSYESSNSQEAAAVVNKVMTTYLANNVLINQLEAARARQFIAQQLPTSEATVRQADANLRKFKQANNITNLEEEEKTALQTISNLENQLTRAQAELGYANTRYAGLINKVGVNSSTALAASSLSQSLGIQQSLRELQQVESQLQFQRTRYKEDYPLIIDLKNRQAALKAVLKQRIANELDGQQQPNSPLQIGNLKQTLIQNLVNSDIEKASLASRVSVLTQALNFYRQRANSFPQLEEGLRELERRLQAAQTTYQTLLKKLQEVQITEKQYMDNARIIEYALVPENPLITKKAITVILGFLLATSLATCIVFFLEVSDTSIKTLKEARKLFDYSCLGNIPYFGKNVIPRGKNPEWPTPELPVRDDPRSPVSAAYRMLQANLKFSDLDKELKNVVITSSVPKEGKSTVAANLATTMAQLGQKVLLIDADLHDPSQHHIWNLTNATGLSNIIADKAEFNQSTVEKVMDNLDVLTSGVIPPNPLAILNSKRMASLVESFSRRYDFVIIDTPPLIEADALTLGKMTDGVLLVVRPGIVNFESATTAKELLEQSAQNTLGLIINGVIPENEFAYSQYKESENKQYAGNLAS